MKITTDWLRQQKAQPHCIATVEAEWGEEVTLNERNLARAADLYLDLHWLAERLLPPADLALYRDLRARSRAALATVAARDPAPSASTMNELWAVSRRIRATGLHCLCQHEPLDRTALLAEQAAATANLIGEAPARETPIR